MLFRSVITHKDDAEIEESWQLPVLPEYLLLGWSISDSCCRRARWRTCSRSSRAGILAALRSCRRLLRWLIGKCAFNGPSGCLRRAHAFAAARLPRTSDNLDLSAGEVRFDRGLGPPFPSVCKCLQKVGSILTRLCSQNVYPGRVAGDGGRCWA